MSTLVIGLTEEQKGRMHAYENDCAREEGLLKGREEARFEDVDLLVSKGVLSVAEACETLEVDAGAYEKHLKTKK